MTDAASREREAWLVWRAQAGDREALGELLKGVQAPPARYVSRLVGERALAEDVLQDVSVRVYRKLRWLREPELFRPWAYRIATREAFKALRRERRWSEQVRDEEVMRALPAAESDAGAPDLIARLPQLAARLSPSKPSSSRPSSCSRTSATASNCSCSSRPSPSTPSSPSARTSAATRCASSRPSRRWPAAASAIDSRGAFAYKSQAIPPLDKLPTGRDLCRDLCAEFWPASRRGSSAAGASPPS